MRYRVIIVDPPWRYGNDGVNGAAEGHYQPDATTGRATMADAEVLALPVGALAAKDAVVLEWATWPKLDVALAAGVAWGFEYVTGLPWIKIIGDPSPDLFGELHISPQYGAGWWVRGCSEPLLIWRRGDPKTPRTNMVGLLSENFGHSRKPTSVHDLAEQMPGPYLELFARTRRPGWDVYGNEVAGSIDLCGAGAPGERADG